MLGRGTVSQNGSALAYAAKVLSFRLGESRRRRCAEDGWALAYAAKAFQSIGSIVLGGQPATDLRLRTPPKHSNPIGRSAPAAVSQNGSALEYAAKAFQSDRVFVLVAWSHRMDRRLSTPPKHSIPIGRSCRAQASES